MPDKRWNIQPFDAVQANALAESLHVKNIYGQLLIQRHIHSYAEAKKFFRPGLEDLHDPFLMKDMSKAVQRIHQAVREKEKILIYGDYDVDGTTAVSTVYSFLHEYYAHTGYYVPHRYREGYGISFAGIDYAKENNYTLIIALDCGIKAIEKIAYAKSLHIDTIVCDHHLPDKQLPDAYAILNPKQYNCEYPYKELSGCGIGFKLITALANTWALSDKSFLQYLDLVATSIAADIVPITGENRVLVSFGLKKINTDPIPGLKALTILCKAKHDDKYQFRVYDLVFIIAPRVNAAGRMDDAHKAIRLFIEKDFEKALHLAEELHQDNTDRKDLDKNMTEEALSIIESEGLSARNSTVLYRSHWHKGVIGIVASRIMETYYRPTIILTQSNEKVAGSARSVKGFNIYEALHQCHDLLENYGGHFYAAGMTLTPDKVEAFIDRFETVVSSSIDPALLIPEIKIDAVIQLREINNSLYKILEQFEPYGPGNMRPVFMASGVCDNGYSRIVKQDHIRFEIKQDDSELFNGIGFNLAHKFDMVSSGKPFDICFHIDENDWNGKSHLQLRVLDIRETAKGPLS